MPNSIGAAENKIVLHDPESKIFDYSDYIHMELVPSAVTAEKKAVRFNRGIVLAGKGYGWDAPGARIRWRTNANNIFVRVFYTGKHNPKNAHNSVGAFSIDGETKNDWTFGPNKKTKPPAGEVRFKLPTSEDNKPHTYEIIMPYGDSVDFLGIETEPGAAFEKPAARVKKQCLFYGDSVTHGFTASNILHTYPFLLSSMNNFQMRNMAIGGHSSGSAPQDAMQFEKLEFDILVTALGTNDWQGKRPPEVYAKNMNAFIDAVRKIKPNTPIYLIGPLWVADEWGKRIQEKYPLQEYRDQLNKLAATRKKTDKHLYYIDGATLIDHKTELFDPILVHPNDQGFAQMADRLSKLIK